MGAGIAGLGQVAVYGLGKKNHNTMRLVQAANLVVMSAFIWAFCVTCMFVLDARDPVRDAVDAGWDIGGRDQLEEAKYCLQEGGAACASFASQLENCTNSTCLSCGSGWILTPRTGTSNCTALVDSPRASCNSMTSSCFSCDRSCRESFIRDVKLTVRPVAFLAELMLLIVLVTLIFNEYVLSTKPDIFQCCNPESITADVIADADTPWQEDVYTAMQAAQAGNGAMEPTNACVVMTTYALNVLVAFVGLGMMVLGIFIHQLAQKNCPTAINCDAFGTDLGAPHLCSSFAAPERDKLLVCTEGVGRGGRMSADRRALCALA